MLTVGCEMHISRVSLLVIAHSFKFIWRLLHALRPSSLWKPICWHGSTGDAPVEHVQGFDFSTGRLHVHARLSGDRESLVQAKHLARACRTI